MQKVNFKRGDQVILLSFGQYGLSIGQATVTLVRDGVVYTNEHFTHFVSKKKFVRSNGQYQSDTYPRFHLRPMTDKDDFDNLKKRAEEASKKYRANRDAYAEMQRQVENEAREWRHMEEIKRGAEIPHGWDYLNRVASRMGFPRV